MLLAWTLEVVFTLSARINNRGATMSAHLVQRLKSSSVFGFIISLQLTAASLSGCGKQAGTMKVTLTDSQTLEFSAVLSKDSNFALNGQILIPPYGDIYFTPASATQGFTFGGRLDLRAFAPGSWQWAEVDRLPTGTFFPPFIQNPLVQVPLGDDFYAYLGVRDQRYFGIAWSFIQSTATPIGVGANYYDKAGNIVMTALFYPPQITNGQVTVPGGLFMATNFSPFLSSPPRPQGQELTVQTYAIEGGVIRESRSSDRAVAQ